MILLVGGCATSGPVYDVPVVDPGQPTPSAPPSISPEVESRPKAQTGAAANTLLVASAEARSNGDFPLAISHIERAIRIEPNNSALWSELALAYLADGESGRARQYAKKALALAGSRGDLKRKAWLVVADIEAQEGNLAKARSIRRKYQSARG